MQTERDDVDLRSGDRQESIDPARRTTSGRLWHVSGPLVARALEDVSEDQVWRVLRKYNISLERRRSWCISTDPEFGPKAADIVGLYLNPPQNALVLCVDEKPSIQALERAQGWLRLPQRQVTEWIQSLLQTTRHDHTVCRLRHRHRPGSGRALQTAAATRVPGLHERHCRCQSESRDSCRAG